MKNSGLIGVVFVIGWCIHVSNTSAPYPGPIPPRPVAQNYKTRLCDNFMKVLQTDFTLCQSMFLLSFTTPLIEMHLFPQTSDRCLSVFGQMQLCPWSGGAPCTSAACSALVPFSFRRRHCSSAIPSSCGWRRCGILRVGAYVTADCATVLSRYYQNRDSNRCGLVISLCLILFLGM